MIRWTCVVALAACSDPHPCDRSISGHICTIAGTGENGYSGDGDQPALSAQLSLPMDTLAAPDGSLYIDDWNNHRIRRWTPDGRLHWVAGNGELGGSLDMPSSGDFNHPTGMLLDPSGTSLYLAAWHNSEIMIIDPATGDAAPSCGNGKRAYTGDDGPALTAALNLPAAIAWSPRGELVILDQANQVIREVDAAGMIHRIAGQCVVDEMPPVGPGPCAMPTACPTPSNVNVCGPPATWCSIPCAPGYAGDEGPALGMRMAQAFGQAADPGGRLAYDRQGNLYFADVANHLIRMIDTQGIVHRVAGQPPQNGLAQHGYAGDGGPALQALLNHPVDLAFGDDGTLYFSDVYNHCIRAIAPDHTIRTVAGQCGEKGSAGDGGPATAALLDLPYGVEVTPDTLYIADSGNNVIRAVHL
jgi:DNA-binding beta-propeller fold protein YncE